MAAVRVEVAIVRCVRTAALPALPPVDRQLGLTRLVGEVGRVAAQQLCVTRPVGRCEPGGAVIASPSRRTHDAVCQEAAEGSPVYARAGHSRSRSECQRREQHEADPLDRRLTLLGSHARNARPWTRTAGTAPATTT